MAHSDQAAPSVTIIILAPPSTLKPVHGPRLCGIVRGRVGRCFRPKLSGNAGARVAAFQQHSVWTFQHQGDLEPVQGLVRANHVGWLDP